MDDTYTHVVLRDAFFFVICSLCIKGIATYKKGQTGNE
jgi:hypothetical protein